MYIVYRVICKKMFIQCVTVCKVQVLASRTLAHGPGEVYYEFLWRSSCTHVHIVRIYVTLRGSTPRHQPLASRDQLNMATIYIYIYIYNTWRGLKNAEKEDVYSIIICIPIFVLPERPTGAKRIVENRFFLCTSRPRTHII